MTFKKAKELSIMKWGYYSLVGKFKRDRLISCGFCKKYSFCADCPLNKKWGMSCNSLDSLYSYWMYCNDNEESKKLAKQILEDIKACHE